MIAKYQLQTVAIFYVQWYSFCWFLVLENKGAAKKNGDKQLRKDARDEGMQKGYVVPVLEMSLCVILFNLIVIALFATPPKRGWWLFLRWV